MRARSCRNASLRRLRAWRRVAGASRRPATVSSGDTQDTCRIRLPILYPVEDTGCSPNTHLNTTFFYVYYALAIGSPRGMQTEQQGRTDAVPAARYTLSRAVIPKLAVQVANPSP